MRIKNLAVGSALCMVFATQAAFAQDAGAQPSVGAAAAGDEVVIQGFRRSLSVASEQKRTADVVSDVIAAEDIGEFPDQNLAESLQRVTGVQITRSAGEGNGVSIRGLPSQFTRVQYNGRTLGSGGTRSFDFTAFSALFTSAVEVIKSPTASMIEGGLSGTVNIRSARPLDIGRSTVSATAEGVYEDLSNKASPRGAVLGNYVNADKTFGLNVGLAYEKRRYIERFLNTYGAETSREAPLFDANGKAIEGGKSPPVDYNVDGDFKDKYSFGHAPDWWNNNGTRARLTAIATLQVKPTENFEIYQDVFFSRLKSDSTAQRSNVRFTDLRPQINGGTNYGVVASTIDTQYNSILNNGTQGFLSSLDVNGLSLQAMNRDRVGVIRVFSIADGIKWTSGRLTVQAEGSYYKAFNKGVDFGLAAQARASAQYSYPDGIGGKPQIKFVRGYNNLDPSNFYLVSDDSYDNRQRDRNYEGRIDLTYDLGSSFFQKAKVGGYASDRRFVNTVDSLILDAKGLAALSGGKLTVNPNVEGTGGILATDFLTPFTYKGFGDTQLLYFDQSKFQKYVSRDAYFTNLPRVRQPASGLDVGEKTLAAYAQADFSGLDDRLSGNIGLRYVRTKLVSTGPVPNLDGLVILPDRVGVRVPASGSKSISNTYQSWLPSFNARFNFTPRFLMRVAAARVLGRPNLGNLSAGASVDANVRVINSGNPNLKPYLSDQVDLSLEYYLPKEGMVSIAGFYKHLTDYIISGQTTEVHTASFEGSNETTTLQFIRNQPLNVASANIKGVEVAAQIPLSYIGEWFDGFGVFGNYTYIDAPKIPRFQGGIPFPLDGVAKNNYNIGAYFDKWGLGARGSYSYRGKYSNGGGTFGDGNFTAAFGQLDASLSYKLNKSISFSVDVTNLLNERVHTSNSFGLFAFENLVGRRYTAGIRAAF